MHKNACPRGHDIYNYRLFLGHHNYKITCSLSDLCMGVEKKIFQEFFKKQCIFTI